MDGWMGGWMDGWIGKRPEKGMEERKWLEWRGRGEEDGKEEERERRNQKDVGE